MFLDDEEEEVIYYEDFFDKFIKEFVKKYFDVKDLKEDEELDEEEYDFVMDKVKLDLFADEEDESNVEGVGEVSDKNLFSFEK